MTRRKLLAAAPAGGLGALALAHGDLAGAAAADADTITIDPAALASVSLPNEGPGSPAETGLVLFAALTQAIENANPQGVIPGASANERDRGTTILLPGLPTGTTYYLDQPVRLPSIKNIRIAAASPRGARLRAADALTEALVSGGPAGDGLGSARFRSHILENLVFHRAGVLIEPNARGDTALLSCFFHDINEPPGQPPAHTTRWAVRAGGRGVVGVRVLNCTFSGMTGGGVQVGHQECDNWLIGDNTSFIRLGGPGVEARSPSVTVRNAVFETKLTGYGDQPYIRIADSGGFGGGAARVVGCRFGGETSPQHHGPPRYCIDLTPDDGSTIINVLIDGNWFNGHTPATAAEPDPAAPCAPPSAGTPDSARSAIRIGKTAHLVHITGNYFRAFQYFAPIIEDAPPRPSPAPGANTFSGNQVDVRVWDPDSCQLLAERRLPTSAEIFANGGAGWSIWPQ
ncbi:MAG: hypothetical protein ACKVWR_03470 [Acidimicrobiales bacterium]